MSELTHRVMEAAEPGSQHEVMWASYVPLHAAANVGKVHLTTPELFPLTLCGIKVGRPSCQFYPGPNDPRCTRCAKKGESS